MCESKKNTKESSQYSEDLNNANILFVKRALPNIV